MRNNQFVILVVEDQELNRFLLEEVLQRAGYAVLAAADGPSARKLAREHLPDLILLDVMMPEEDGYQTCRLLKEEPVTAEIPVIFITALDELKDRLEGLDLGALDYISKPFQVEELLARVRNYLKLYHAHFLLRQEWAHRLQQVQEAHQAILVDPAALPAARCAVRYRTVLEAGGDFYDVFEMQPGLHGYLVADISGHDLGASFQVPALKALIRQNSSMLYTPAETIRTINRVLATIFKEEQFLTAVYLVVDRGRNVVAMVNAGHLPVLHLGARGEVRWLTSNSDILGAFADGNYRSQEFPVGPGDRLVLCTDGLIESFAGEMVSHAAGLDRLREVALRTRVLPAEEAVAVIAAELQPEGGAPAQDDYLLLLVDV
ncbi:MAG: SpoIIE family protein phosphatase [Thermodesulfobacteriota bacterium]